MTEETENVSDAILHAMGKAIDTASDEQNVSAALKQLGYPALAAFYASRAPKTATR